MFYYPRCGRAQYSLELLLCKLDDWCYLVDKEVTVVQKWPRMS
mgnify:CR=1 FL=1